jgi:hypothetical protein
MSPLAAPPGSVVLQEGGKEIRKKMSRSDHTQKGESASIGKRQKGKRPDPDIYARHGHATYKILGRIS